MSELIPVAQQSAPWLVALVALVLRRTDRSLIRAVDAIVSGLSELGTRVERSEDGQRIQMSLLPGQSLAIEVKVAQEAPTERSG